MKGVREKKRPRMNLGGWHKQVGREIACSEEGSVQGGEQVGIGWVVMGLKSSPLHKLDMLMIQPSRDIKRKVVCMILELRKEVCKVALYCCLCCYCNKSQYQQPVASANS